METGRSWWLVPAMLLAATPVLAQAPAPPRPAPAPSPAPATAALVQVVIRAQGTADRYATTTSFICEEGRFCTAVFDLQRRPAAPAPAPAPAPGTPPRAESRPAPPPPARVEIGAWSRPDGEVMLVALMAGQKLMLNCKPSQMVATKGRGEPPRIRYSVHETDPACGSALARAPAEKAVAAIEVLVRPAAMLRGQGI
jgi:hypothetical protein